MASSDPLLSTLSTRRRFLRHLGVGTAAFLAPHSRARVAGANDDIRVAVVGIRGRGRGAIGVFRKLPGVRVTALCDADTEFLDRERAAFSARGEQVETYVDYRKLLESPNVDAVAVATPNHWHALMGIWACEAGKDAYIEKPISHNVWEGRQLTKAAAKSGRIVQAGTQYRSDPGVIEAVKFVRAGNLGKIKCARGFAYFRRESIGKVDGPQQPPATVDYDLWTGPAPLVPLRRKSLHKDWHFVWATGNGELSNMGVHEMDICRWFLDEPAVAPRIVSIGGRFGFIDDGETPNTQVVLCDYARAPVIFEVRGLPARPGAEAMDAFRDVSIGVVIECEGGHIAWGRAGGTAYDSRGRKIRDFKGNRGRDHHQNFIDAVRARRAQVLRCPPETCHISSAICHIGNISHRLGQARTPGEIRERAAAQPRLAEAWDRMQQHLAVNGVALERERATMGAMLEFDSESERFTGAFAAEAAPHLTRNYRRGFEVRTV